MAHFRNALLGAIALAALTACSPTRSVEGYVPDEDVIAQIRPGIHDRNSVASLMGTPSSTSTFSDSTWYYIGRETEQLAFLEEDVLEQRVVAVTFDDAGIVKDVRTYDLDDAQELALVDRVTPTRGREMTVLEQLFGNLGRFNSQSDSGLRPMGRR